MNPQIDILGPITLRAAAILTTSYVGALLSSVLPTGRRVEDYNQLIVYVDFTIGSLTTAEIKFEFAGTPDGSDLYQETEESDAVASNVDTKAVNQVIHQLSITGKYRFAFPLAEKNAKVSIKGTGTTTSSSAKISFSLGKTYA